MFFFFGLVPLSFIIAFSALELAIAFIQSQVFVVLSSSLKRRLALKLAAIKNIYLFANR
jgi:hypothetical protein